MNSKIQYMFGHIFSPPFIPVSIQNHIYIWFTVFSGGKGRNCVQGNNMGVNGPHCPERTNSSQSAELCHGQDCPFR